MDEEENTTPTLSVDSAEIVATENGDVARFTLELDETSDSDITFDFTATADSGDESEPTELRADSGTIAAGAEATTIDVALSDLDRDAIDSIRLEISNADGAEIDEASETLALDDDDSDDETEDEDDAEDDDGEPDDDDDDRDDEDDGDDDETDGDDGEVTLPPPARFDVSPNPLIVSEGDQGEITTAEFEVARAFPGKPPVDLDYRVVVPDNGADAADFGGTLPDGQLSFSPGEDGSQTITIPIVGDGETEPNESFRLEVVDPAIGNGNNQNQFEGVAGFANGIIEGTGDSDGTGDDDSDDDTGDEDSGPGATTASRAILQPEATLNLVDSADVFGRAEGDEGVFVADGVTGVGLDANIERVDIPSPLADLTFQVADNGFTVGAGGETLVSVPSLNQPLTLAVDGGSLTVTQTGAATFALSGTDDGSVEVGSEPVTDPGITLAEGGASAPEPGSESSANIFVGANANYAVGDAVNAFGRNDGDEALLLTDAAQSVRADANFERIDFAQDSGALTFQVTDAGLTVSEGETTLLTVPSLNGDVDARFGDGNVTLRQTGAETFEAEGAEGNTVAVGTEEASSLDGLTLGPDTSATSDGGTGTDPDVRSIDSGNAGESFDATSGDLTFDFASGDYGVTIDGFDTGDVLDARDIGGDSDASVTLENDSDQTDGVQGLTLVDPTNGAQTNVELAGLTEEQDDGAFNLTGFTNTFGEDSLLL